MDTLIVEFSESLVDNPVAPSSSTKVEIDIKSSSGRIKVEDYEEGPRSIHRFIVKDATELGCGDPHNLNAEQAAIILAISCSLTNPRILFSLLQPCFLSSSLKLGETPSKVETSYTPTEINIAVTETIRITESVSTCLGTKLSLDETQIYDVANRLLTFRIFDSANRSLLELNVIEAIKRYREALMSVDGVACYSSLYNSFEKAINADKDRKDKAFDVAASQVTGLQESKIESLRFFNNRVKHILRDSQDINVLKASEAQFGELARNLKKAADSAILSRI